MGDSNGDRVADRLDVDRVTAALGSTVDRDANLNGDGAVDSIDRGHAVRAMQLGRRLAAGLPLDG